LPAPGRSMRMAQLLEAVDVAALLGMTKDWVYAQVRENQIPHVRLGRCVRFRQESIDNWIQERERGTLPRTR
jgi:excisionase family DNA binding protein